MRCVRVAWLCFRRADIAWPTSHIARQQPSSRCLAWTLALSISTRAHLNSNAANKSSRRKRSQRCVPPAHGTVTGGTSRTSYSTCTQNGYEGGLGWQVGTFHNSGRLLTFYEVHGRVKAKGLKQ